MSDESPETLPALVLRAARDIGQVSTAFDADILLSTLLGSVYTAVLPDRGAALDSFARALREHIVTVDDPAGPLVARVLDSLSHTPATGLAPDVAWAGQIGAIRVTGAYVYGDRYGDQTSYVATYAYADEELGGPEHAVVVLADHNLGLAKDIFVAAPAAAILVRLQADVATEDDAMSWFLEVEPSTVRTAAMAYLGCTDMAPELPEGDSLPSNRALALGRLALLPVEAMTPTPTDVVPATPVETDHATMRAALIADFLDSPESDLAGFTEFGGERRESLTYCLALFVDFAGLRGDPLRWSPAGVEMFLTMWVHERAILDADDTEVLPDALRAWVAWAGRVIDLPTRALQKTLTSIRETRGEFARLCATGERQSPAAKAMAQLVADGVDLTDPDAVDIWLKTYNIAD